MSTDTVSPSQRRLRHLAVFFGAVLVLAVGLFLFAMYRATDGWRRPQASIDIRGIDRAVRLFHSKFNVGSLAATGGGPNGEFRLCTGYADADGNWLDWPEAKYLKQLFPAMDVRDNGLRWNGESVGPESPRLLDVNQSLVFFLAGGPFTKYEGFSLNTNRPFTPPEKAGERRIGPFLDFPASRFDADGRLLDPWGTPFAYFTAVQGNDYTGSFTWNGSTVKPYREPDKPDQFMNQKGFQIICAGRNGVFGPGGKWTPSRDTPTGDLIRGTCEWAAGAPGADDRSNFNTGTLDRRW